MENKKQNLKQLKSEPIGKVEITDGSNWFALATENWVLNNVEIEKAPICTVATIANLVSIYNNGQAGVGATLTSVTEERLAIDQTFVDVGDLVLVKNQAAKSENGIYVVTNIGSDQDNWVLTRSTSFNSVSQMEKGIIINVISGSYNKLTAWMLMSTIASIGSDSIIFVAFSNNSTVDNDVYALSSIMVLLHNQSSNL